MPTPQRMAAARLGGVLMVAGAGAAAGCGTNAPTYFPAGTMLEVNTGGADSMPEAIGTVQLPFRRPNDVEERQRQSDSERLMYEVPWLREDRVHVQVLYTVTNNDNSEGTFNLRIDGATEFTRYDEDAVAAVFEAAGEDPVLLGLIQMVPQTLGPGQVYHGTVREDDFHEASLDLDAMGRFMAPFAGMLSNRSEVTLDWVPLMPPLYSIRPALWEIQARFTADRKMTCEFLVRVRDDDDRLLQDGQPAFNPQPETFMPVVVMAGG